MTDKLKFRFSDSRIHNPFVRKPVAELYVLLNEYAGKLDRRETGTTRLEREQFARDVFHLLLAAAIAIKPEPKRGI
jgi:hypothetical protein